MRPKKWPGLIHWGVEVHQRLEMPKVLSTVVPVEIVPEVDKFPVKLPPEIGRYDPPVIATPFTDKLLHERAPVTERAPFTVAWPAAS